MFHATEKRGIVLKKIACTILIVVLLMLSACANRPQDLNTVALPLTNRSDGEIYGIHIEYLLDGNPTGGQIAQHADGSAIGVGDVIDISFQEKDFPDGADLSGFSIVFYVMFSEEQEVPAGEAIAIPIAYGHSYPLSLTGNRTDGYAISIDE